uniref:Late secretory pathway protein AVL9 homolog n=1 Tax=Phallusia mammillata TaxID=59560 RepID=A0A6F9D836_9ASCI|nr:late secretory pathway protein AVL9 homolog [Phallusia mammillata]
MNIATQDKAVLHVVVVGFHHKKGCQVEYAYPPLIDGEPHDSTNVPNEWKYLPSLVLPDGAHNYNEDTIYFHLPPREHYEKQTTVFGVSCYRQISSDLLKRKDADITRGTVQKSVVVLSQKPLYGILNAKLHMITQAYFEEKDFSKIDILKELFDHVNLSMSRIDESQRFLDLSARTLVLRFQHQIVMLFKLLLLERRMLFYTSPVKHLVGGIMALLSLFPSMIDKGLKYSTTPYSKYIVNSKIHDDEQVATEPPADSNHNGETEEKVVTPNGPNVFQQPNVDTLQSVTVNENMQTDEKPVPSELSGEANVANKTRILSETNSTSSLWSTTSDRAMEVAQNISTGLESLTSAVSTAFYNTETIDSVGWEGAHEIEDDDDLLLPGFGNARLEIKTESPAKTQNSNLPQDLYIERGDAIAKPRSSTMLSLLKKDGYISPIECDSFGFPLSVFTRGYLCLPYVALQQHGDLMENLERGYVIGATNILFKSNPNLADVVVDLEEPALDIRDANLKRLTHLSAADLRFAQHLVDNVTEEDDSFDTTGWEGGNEWIQAQFLEYMLSMLAISTEVNANPKDMHDFNEYFLAAWKQTQNYQVWASKEHPSMANIKPIHPFQAQYSVSDMRLRLHHNLQSSDRGRKIEDAMVTANQAVANTGKFMGSALVSAKSSVTSWWSNRSKNNA